MGSTDENKSPSLWWWLFKALPWFLWDQVLRLWAEHHGEGQHNPGPRWKKFVMHNAPKGDGAARYQADVERARALEDERRRAEREQRGGAMPWS